MTSFYIEESGIKPIMMSFSTEESRKSLVCLSMCSFKNLYEGGVGAEAQVADQGLWLWRQQDHVSLESFSSDLEMYKITTSLLLYIWFHFWLIFLPWHKIFLHLHHLVFWKENHNFFLFERFNICNFLLYGRWKCVFLPLKAPHI